MTRFHAEAKHPSPSDKEKLEFIITLVKKIFSMVNDASSISPKVNDLLDLIYKTLTDLSFSTAYITKEDLLKDIEVLRALAKKNDPAPFISYLSSMARLIKSFII